MSDELENLKKELFEKELSTPEIHSEHGHMGVSIHYRHYLWGTNILEWAELHAARRKYIDENYKKWWKERVRARGIAEAEERARKTAQANLERAKKSAHAKLTDEERKALGI